MVEFHPAKVRQRYGPQMFTNDSLIFTNDPETRNQKPGTWSLEQITPNPEILTPNPTKKDHPFQSSLSLK
jgi:hypothetical protein